MTDLFSSLTLTQKRLLILVRYGLWGKITDTSLFKKTSFSEWEELVELATIQGVSGIAFDGIKGLTEDLYPPKNILIKWALSVEEIEKRYHHQVKALQSLATIFKENNMKCLLLKGVGTGKLYPIPEHRECGDLDIYLFGDYDRCNHLMEEKGIRVDYEDEKHSKFFFHSVPVENHSSFLQLRKNQTNRDYEMVLLQDLTKQDDRFSDDYGVYIPSLTFNLLFLFNHAVRHFLASGIVLRHMCDWAVLLNQCRDMKVYIAFYETMKRFDMTCYADAFNLIAQEYLGLSKTDQDIGNPDTSFTQKVFTDIMNQKKLYPIAPQRSRIKIFRRKVDGAIFLFRNRWKYKAMNGKVFLSEFLFHMRGISQIINIPKHNS